MKNKILIAIIVGLIISLMSSNEVKAQCCDPILSGIPTYIVDLSSTPDSVWISPDVGRDGISCCDNTESNCVQFIIYTHPSSTEAAFGVASPPDPPGQFYRVDCGVPAHMGQPVCVQGGDTVCILYCKGGNDMSEYAITVSNTVEASPDIAVSNGCTAEIWATGFDGYVEWNSIAPGNYGDYNSYLDCQTCATTGVTPQAGYPPYVDYAVIGDVYSPCTMLGVTDTVRVYFVDEKGVNIVPDNPSICYGGSDTVITAQPYGGAPPYEYLWSTGETTQSITVAGGTYWVEVSDSTDCPHNFDTVTVHEFFLPIEANAGQDFSVCLSETTIDINGIIQAADGGTWSGGSNSFTPSADSLITTYNPTLSEIVAGNTIELFLTTTGNYGCPPDTDTLNIIYLPDLTVSAGGDQLVCEDVTNVTLNGTISDGITSGVWTTLDGTGMFTPNNTDLTTHYLPTAQDTANGFVTIVFSSDGIYDCEPKSDTIIVTFGANPTPDFSFVNACLYDSISFTDLTTNAVSWLWDFGNGNTDNTSTPLNQTYPNSGDFIVSLTVEDGLGCVGVMTDTITVYHVPVADFLVTDFCEQEIIPFTDASTIIIDTIVSWQWDFDNGNTSNLQNPTNIFSPNGNYNVELIVSSNHCVDTILTIVKINPIPVLSVATDMTQGCNHATVVFTNNTTGADNYHWDFGDGVTTTEISPSHTFTNDSDTNMVFMVEQIAFTIFGCSDTLVTAITIHPTPQPELSSDALPGCSPLEVVFTNNSLGASSYLWDFGDGNTSTDAAPSYTFINTSSFIEYFNVVLTATSAYGCTDSVNQYITVFPNPTSYINILPDSTCSPANVLFTTTAGQYSYEWFYGDGTSEMANAAAWHTYYNFGDVDSVYQVELITTTPLGCQDTVSNNLVVHPTPIANFTIDTLNGCSPITITITNTSTGANNYVWDFGDGNITVNNTPTFTYTYINNTGVNQSFIISLTASNATNCENIISKSITVYSAPVAAFTEDYSEGCSPLNITFNNETTGANVYFWDFNDGNISTNTHPVNTFANSGTIDTIYHVNLVGTSIYGCKDTAYFNVTVHPQPEALFALLSSAGCSPYVSDITNNSSGAINYQWNFGDGQTSTNPNINIQHEYINNTIFPADYQIELIAENNFGCYDTVIQTLVVYPTVEALFNVDTFGCAPLDLTFTNNSIGAVLYEWNFGDGSSSNSINPSHLFNNLDETNTIIYTTTLIATSYYSCVDSMQQEISVFPVPNAIFAINENNAACSPYTSNISNGSTGSDTYVWNFGDGQTSTTNDLNILHEYINNTVAPVDYEIKLIAENSLGCSDTTTHTLEVYPTVEAVFEVDTFGCAPLDLSFSNNSTGAVIYEWNFGDGSSSNNNNPSHLFNNLDETSTIVYTTTLIATSYYSCVDSIQQEISVFPVPKAIFAVNEIVGCSPFTALIENSSLGAQTYDWDYDDGNTDNISDAEFNHLFENISSSTTTFNIELNVLNVFGCSDTASQVVTVYPNVVADFYSDSIGCSPLEIDFINTSDGAETYYWTFGDDATSGEYHTAHTFTNNDVSTVNYTVTLDIESEFGCTSSKSRTIQVLGRPVAQFTATPSYQLFPSTTIQINNQTSGSWAYNWDFGNGETSINPSPTSLDYGTWGEYTIELKAYSQFCRDSISHTIIIDAPPPIAAFEPEAQGCAPLTVTFENSSLYSDSYLWNLGDGTGSTQENPVITYYEPGIYVVTLRTSGLGGEDLAPERIITVYPDPIADFKAVPARVTIPDEEVHFINLSEHGMYYIWDLGDGTISHEEAPIHSYSTIGFFDITLFVESEFGCLDTITKQAIETVSDCDVIFPNALAPITANIEENRYFKPIYKGVTNYELQIFDQWGELIFVSSDPDVGWDGMYKGEVCKLDVYVWKAEWTCVSGKEFIRTGDLTLIR